MSSAAIAYARENKSRFLAELKALLRIPSVSTDPAHAGMSATQRKFSKRSWNTSAWKTSGSSRPVLQRSRAIRWFTRSICMPRSKPTGLLYGHYDVQPPDPLDEWLSPPFEPDRAQRQPIRPRSGRRQGPDVHAPQGAGVSARHRQGPSHQGARDPKEKKKWAGRELRLCRFEPADLNADFALVSDTEMFAPGLPTLCVGLRGMIYTEIEVRGARTDLHSGMYGGAAPNPFVALAQIIAG